jgi:hypothetical protein
MRSISSTRHGAVGRGARGAIAALAALALAACSDKAPSNRDGVIDAWKKAGLTVSTMSAVEGKALGGGDCQAGTIGGLDVTLCTYGSDKAASAAQDAGLASVGGVTGASLAQGSMLLVVADRRNVDPSGRTIDQVTKAFRGRK